MWSHTAVDFLTDLPVSQGYTTILVMVDQFSKSCRFLPFNSFPSAFQVAEALFQHVFCCYGFPEGILFDCGSQFVSGVWKVFFRKVWVIHSGPQASLTL